MSTPATRDYPAYDELPELGGLGVRHARDVLGPAGTLEFAEPTAVAAAARGVTGETVPLNLALDAFDPPLFDRAPVVHRVIETGRNEVEDVLDAFNPQASSQLDGLAHVRAREFGFFGGATTTAQAQRDVGMHHWAARGIAARGVLLDAAAAGVDPFAGDGLTPSDLIALAVRQKVELRRGDALLVRTGWAAAYLAGVEGATAKAWTGLHAGEDTARFLWDRRISLLGADNPAVENAPGSREAGSLHRRLLPALGLPLMELLDLERLAARCAALGRWEFLLVSVPLNVPGGVSSPANAMALL